MNDECVHTDPFSAALITFFHRRLYGDFIFSTSLLLCSFKVEWDDTYFLSLRNLDHLYDSQDLLDFIYWGFFNQFACYVLKEYR